jgi:hypothetical protein
VQAAQDQPIVICAAWKTNHVSHLKLLKRSGSQAAIVLWSSDENSWKHTELESIVIMLKISEKIWALGVCAQELRVIWVPDHFLCCILQVWTVWCPTDITKSWWSSAVRILRWCAKLWGTPKTITLGTTTTTASGHEFFATRFDVPASAAYTTCTIITTSDMLLRLLLGDMVRGSSCMAPIPMEQVAVHPTGAHTSHITTTTIQMATYITKT